MKNILILNSGTRNKLIRYFKKELSGKAMVIATDSFFLAPSIYEADKYYVTDRYDTPDYWDKIDDICEKNNIGMIISLIDPELEKLAERKQYYEEKGILVNIGDYKVVHDCFDKMNTINFVKSMGMDYIKSYTDYNKVISEIKNGDLQFPLFAKPRCGSGSTNVAKINDINQLKNYCQMNQDYIIQEYIDGQEIGVDLFVDLISGEVISIFAKKKLKMRAGETDKSVSYKNETLFDMIKKFAREFNLKGVNDIDVFEKDGKFYISEVNPRFGGGYLHAYECGVNFPAMLINNMNKKENKPNISDYRENIYMMKYFDVNVMEVN